MDILPTNFEKLITENNLQISKENISQLLLDGYVTTESSSDIQISKDSPLLLNTENIAKYFYNSVSRGDKNLQKKIEKVLSKTTAELKIKAFLIYPFLSFQERETIGRIYSKNVSVEELENNQTFNKLLNLTSDKEKYVALIQVKDSLSTEISEKKNNTYISNNIYLEENEEYYTSLLNYIHKKKEALQTLGIYTNEYEELISDMKRIVEKDNSVYPKILNLESKYLLLASTEDKILTISTTDKQRENTTLNNLNFNDQYPVIQTAQSKGSVRIPVIMYHQIDNPPAGASSFIAGLYTSVEEFEKQIAYLTKQNYNTISSQEFLDILKSGENPSQKTVMLTFDDSTTSHYTNAYRILKKYKQKGTFFVVSHKSQISNEHLKQMSDNGMDIQSHTQTHPDLVKLKDLNRLQSEIGGSKAELQARTGKEVLAIAYPGCVADSKTFKSVANNGYQLGFSCGKSIDHRYSTNLSLSRVHNPYSVDDLKKILSGIYPF